MACLVMVFSCAPIKTRQGAVCIPEKKIRELRAQLDFQSGGVKSFITTGRMVISNTTQRIPATFLCVATREPFRLKAEVIHTWGFPLVNILVNGEHVTIDDLYHKRRYQGQLGILGALAHGLPPLDKNLLWSIMRAYPEVMDRERLSWSHTQQTFIVTNGGNTEQLIPVDSEAAFPSTVIYPHLGLKLRFSGLKSNHGFIYASHVDVSYPEKESEMQITIKEIIFNKEIEPGLFN